MLLYDTHDIKTVHAKWHYLIEQGDDQITQLHVKKGTHMTSLGAAAQLLPLTQAACVARASLQEPSHHPTPVLLFLQAPAFSALQCCCLELE